MKEFQHLYDTYLIKPATSILHDPYRLFMLENNLFEPVLTNKVPIDVQNEFLELYPEWIKSSQLNNFEGIDSFPFKYISLGVTQGIDDFVLYCLKNNKRLRMSNGEYGYSFEISNHGPVIENAPLEKGDALIISCPFSPTGDIHPAWDEIIETCNNLKIPVFVDAAFFGVCMGVNVNLNQPCIDTVSFSPTKGLNCGNLRTGITFTHRQGKDCSLDILSKWHHGIHFHTYLAYNLMKNFGPDTIPKTYRTSQLAVCDRFGLTPSKTMMFGIGNNEWDYFTRSGVTNRVNIRNAIRDFFLTGKIK